MTDDEIAAGVSEQPPDGMKREASAFYHDPPLWVGSSPVDFTSPVPPDFDAFNKTVFRETIESGIEIKVTTEGIFAFSFAGWKPGVFPPEQPGVPPDFDDTAGVVLNRTLVMNSFLACLYTNEEFEHERMVVTPELLISMRDLDDMGMGFGNQRVSHLAMSRFPSTYVSNIPFTMDNRISMRAGIIPLEVVEKTTQDLSSIMSTGKAGGLQLADLFLKASKSYQDHNHSLAVITYWAITERLIQELWRRYQADNKDRDGKTFITKQREQRLTDGRTFTAAVITEILSFAGYIDYDLYSDISKVRKCRNDWMHSLVANISRSDSARAASVCSRLLHDVRGIDLAGKGGLRIHG